MATLALRLYRLEHGAYPESLEALAPRYLATVPADPFALNAALRYRRKGSKYVLYSIGPDGVDNGGAAILSKDPTRKGPSRYTVTQDSTGDIVAGVNTH
jgi:hypothetical protein